MTTIHVPKKQKKIVLQTFYYKKNRNDSKMLRISCNAMNLVLRILRVDS